MCIETGAKQLFGFDACKVFACICMRENTGSGYTWSQPAEKTVLVVGCSISHKFTIKLFHKIQKLIMNNATANETH